MKSFAIAVVAALLCVVASSCGDSHCPGGTGDDSSVLYFSSFESAADTTGWWGVTDDMFVSDPAPNCGERSLLIGGGCIQPAAYVVLGPAESDAEYSISCWGKLVDEARPGAVVLVRTEEGGAAQQIGLLVDSAEWKRYRSQDTLYCPGGEELRLEVWIGGLIGASMLVDYVEVREAD